MSDVCLNIYNSVPDPQWMNQCMPSIYLILFQLIIILCKLKTSLNILDELAPFIDEPIADSSILPSFLVSKLTRMHVKVALGGDGGDELFGGYQHYQNILWYCIHEMDPNNFLNLCQILLQNFLQVFLAEIE